MQGKPPSTRVRCVDAHEWPSGVTIDSTSDGRIVVQRDHGASIALDPRHAIQVAAAMAHRAQWLLRTTPVRQPGPTAVSCTTLVGEPRFVCVDSTHAGVVMVNEGPGVIESRFAPQPAVRVAAALFAHASWVMPRWTT